MNNKDNILRKYRNDSRLKKDKGHISKIIVTDIENDKKTKRRENKNSNKIAPTAMCLLNTSLVVVVSPILSFFFSTAYYHLAIFCYVSVCYCFSLLSYYFLSIEYVIISCFQSINFEIILILLSKH